MIFKVWIRAYLGLPIDESDLLGAFGALFSMRKNQYLYFPKDDNEDSLPVVFAKITDQTDMGDYVEIKSVYFENLPKNIQNYFVRECEYKGIGFRSLDQERKDEILASMM